MDQPVLVTRQSSLSSYLISFVQYLRTKGFIAGTSDIEDALNVISWLDATRDPEILKQVLKSVITKTQKEHDNFDLLFYNYWRELDKAEQSKIAEQPEKKPSKPKTQQETFNALKNWLHGNKQKESMDTATVGNQEAFTSRSFNTFSPEELEAVTKLIRQIARKLAVKVSRRHQRTNKKAALDIKKTIRLNLHRVGEIIDLSFKQPKKDKWGIVLLCDISQSMELYSYFLIQFLYAFQSNFKKIETFVFSTSITRVSDFLKGPDSTDALKQIGDQVKHWSSGTRIGHCFQEFVKDYGRKMVHKKTYVIILSDGWETGDPEMLSNAMYQLKKASGKIIWLNPLAGNPHFKPEAIGMKKALPYIDIFAPVHNLESLQSIAKFL